MNSLALTLAAFQLFECVQVRVRRALHLIWTQEPNFMNERWNCLKRFLLSPRIVRDFEDQRPLLFFLIHYLVPGL